VLRDERAAGPAQLLLLDPPYERWAELEPRLGEPLAAVVADRGVVVVETGHGSAVLPLDLVTTRRYGSARLTVFAP
jgi:16S rRNA G966 N2-methylase RsmD